MACSRSRLIACALAGCAFPAASARAQITPPAREVPANAPVPAAQDTDGSAIQDIVVTARRTNESAQSIPLAISVLGAQKLKDENITGIADIARTTPNFFVQTASADPTSLLLTIRGQSQQDSVLTTESPIGVYVDGINYIRSSNLETALIDAERVEVLKGPQGTLYGKNTTGGAISIATRQPDLKETGGYLDGIIGNRSREEVTGVLNLPLVTDQLGVRLMGHYADHGSYGRNGDGDGIGDKRQSSFRANALYRPNDQVRLALSADYTHFKSNGPLTKLAFVSPFPSPAPGTPNPAPSLLEIALGQGILNPALLADPIANQQAIGAALFQARQLFASYADGRVYHSDATAPQGVFAKTYGTSANLAIDFTPDLEFRSITGIRWLKRDEMVDLDSTPFSILNADLSAHARNISQELQLAGQNHSVFNWIIGAYANKETGVDSSSATALASINPANPNITEGHVRNTSWAVFGQGVVSLSDTLRATVGARWTEEHKELRSFNRSGPGGSICNIPANLQVGGMCEADFKNKFSDYSYLASLDWKPTTGVLLYARTARGFKGGGENLRGTGTADSFAAFKPEKVTDYEVGIKSDFLDRHVRINADLFYANYRDIQRTIVQASSSGSIVSLVTNAARARIQGAEADITVVPARGLTLSASGGVTDGKYKKFVDATGDRSNEPFQFPKYSYALTGVYEVPTSAGPLRFIADYNWRSKTELVGSTIYAESLRQKAYGLLGARAALTIRSFDADIALFGKNLTNRRYAVSAVQFDNSLGFNMTYTGEPRLFGIQLTKRFGGG